jgi:guanylate kinase
MPKVIIISAPSGSGKSTIINYLLKNEPSLEFSVSATSRQPRGKECNGVDYYFLTPEMFREKIAGKEFLEYEEVYKDCFYGTLRSEVGRILRHRKNPILDIDVVGGCNLKKYFGNRALSIFIRPPVLADLKERLEKRGTESPQEISRRLEKAGHELSFARLFDVVVINDDLDTACAEALEFVQEFVHSRNRTWK